MRKILLAILIIIVFLSGCVQTADEEYRTDIITIENYEIGTYAPYSGGNTYIMFDIFHNGGGRDWKVDEVTVEFFNIVNFEKYSLNCDGENIDGKKCMFRDVEVGDLRPVLFELTAKKVDGTRSEEGYFSFSVSYDYGGTRVFLIPFVNKIGKKPTLRSYESGKPSGPVLLDIQPEIEKEVTTQEGTVKEYWGVVGKTFETKFKFTHVGSIPDAKVTMPAGSVKLSVKKLQIQEPCNVEEKSITVADDEEESTLVCNFKVATETPNIAEGYAEIQADYTYSYEFTKTETFTINPIQA